MDQLMGRYMAHLYKLGAYMDALNVLNYDSETAMPKAGAPARGRAMGLLSGEAYTLSVGEDMQNLLAELEAHKDDLNEATKRCVELLREEMDETARIPKEEFMAFQMASSESLACWRDAKGNNDYASMEPHLKKLLEYRIRFASYMKPGVDPFDVWLDKHEKGMTSDVLDPFFAEVKAKLVPLIHAISERGRKIDASYMNKTYPIDKQRELSEYIRSVMTIDPNHCVMGEVEHPFMSALSSQDVRMTTHYYEDTFLSSLFSVIHEGGHALYEMGVDPSYDYTPIGTGASTGMHESQSRLFENMIGRREEFINLIYPKIVELFPTQFEGVTAEMLYLAANKSQPSLVRIEADELTYSLHIMVRYELERQLFAGTITTAELPQRWNAMYKEYLGVDVPNDTLGVLQDTHWPGAMFGYFPSYAVGSAYAAQIFATMEKEMDVGAQIKTGNLAPIVEWLREKIHKYGMLKKPQELLEAATGESFNPKYYTDYLIKKYSRIYGL